MEYNTIKEMKEILDAIEQGKELQWYDVFCAEWIDTTNKRPDFSNFTYRIKPEEPKKKEKEKKWRPFRDTEELFAHNNGNYILWLKEIRSDQYQLVRAYDSDTIKTYATWTMGELLENYTFKDGTPCGIIINEEGKDE